MMQCLRKIDLKGVLPSTGIYCEAITAQNVQDIKIKKTIVTGQSPALRKFLQLLLLLMTVE